MTRWHGLCGEQDDGSKAEMAQLCEEDVRGGTSKKVYELGYSKS